MRLWRRILRERRGVVLPLALLLGANVAVMGLVFLPLQRGVSAGAGDVLQAQADMAAARREAAEARAANEGTRGADADLRALYETILPQGFDGAVQVTGFWLNRVAERTGVRFERGQYDPEMLEDSSLERMTAQATLSGGYDGVRRFLHAVESAPEFVIIDRVELAQPNDENEDSLELLLDVSTYYRARESGPMRRTRR